MTTFLFYFISLLSAFSLSEIFRYFLFVEQNRDFWWTRLIFLVFNSALAYLLCLQWQMWQIIPFVFVLHAVVEWLPAPFWRSFLFKHGLRIMLMTGLAFLLSESLIFRLTQFHQIYLQILLLFNGIFLTLFASGELVGRVTEQMAIENKLEWRGLDNGGLWIGRLERLLIFIFVMIGLPSGIGFLVAAKSILRFSDTRDDQKMAEYVLIGTLISFSLAIIFAYLTKKALNYVANL